MLPRLFVVLLPLPLPQELSELRGKCAELEAELGQTRAQLLQVITSADAERHQLMSEFKEKVCACGRGCDHRECCARVLCAVSVYNVPLSELPLAVRMGGSDNKGDGLVSQPRRYLVPGQPVLNRHQVGGVSRSPDGLFAQQERVPIRGRPTVRGERTYGGRPGQRVEEQGTWASRTQNHSEAGYGRPVDRGAWTAKTVKRPRQQPAHPQYANYWAPLTRKRHTMPHSSQPQHTNYWAPRMRKRHQQEHRPQRQTEHSDRTQHAKGRTGDCPGPRKETATRRNVTRGDGGGVVTQRYRWSFRPLTSQL